MTEKIKYHVLSPKILVEGEDKGYNAVCELHEVLKMQECRNVALIGAYGSGKSSVIQTLCKNHLHNKRKSTIKRIRRFFVQLFCACKYRLQNIFCDKEYIHTQNEPLKYINVSLATFFDTSNGEGKIEEFEQGLLKQLFYSVKPSKICQSRLKTIKVLKRRDLMLKITGIVLFIIALAFIFQPPFLRNSILSSGFDIYNCKGYGWLSCSVHAVIWIVLVLCVASLSKWVVRRLHNATISKVVTGIGSMEASGASSVLSKHMDEIVYFFEANDYDIVFFEDIDRYGGAIKIFTKLREINLLINNSHFCKNGRVVKFVYAIRGDVFEGDQTTKFFDYIITLMPIVNYGNAMNQLEEVLANAGITDVNESDIVKIGAFIGSMRELKNIVNQTRQHINMLTANLKPASLLAMAVYKSKFPMDYELLNNNMGVLYTAMQSKSVYIKTIAEHLAGEGICSDNETLEIKSLRNVLMELNDPIKTIKSVCIEEYKKRGGSDVDRYMELCRFVLFLLQSGYINEHSYQNYITYFSPGALTKQDNDFYLDLLVGESNDIAEVKLIKVSELIERIDVDTFKTDSVLNYDLLEGLVAIRECEKLEVVRWYIISDKKLGFIADFYKSRQDSKFVANVVENWNEYLLDMIRYSEENEDDKNLLVKLFYLYRLKNVESKEVTPEEVEFLASNVDVFAQCYDALEKEGLLGKIEELDVKFTNIVRPENEDACYSYILDNSLYEINETNVNTVIGEQFKAQAYTAILALDETSEIRAYLLNDIEALHKCISDGSVDESKEAIEYLLYSELNESDLLDYIKNQKYVFDSVEDIEFSKRELLFVADRVKPTWGNVINQIDKYEFGEEIGFVNILSEKLIRYVERHLQELKEIVAMLSEEDKDQLMPVLFGGNRLDFNAYAELLSVMNYKFEEFDLTKVDNSRKCCLVENNAIVYQAECVEAIQEDVPEMLALYLINNFDDYLKDDSIVVELNNSICIDILNSSITLVQKVKWMQQNDINIVQDGSEVRLADLICHYYSGAIDDGLHPDINYNLLYDAISKCAEWNTQISLVNKINRTISYNEEIVRALLFSLGGEYVKLNELKLCPKFEKNPQNLELIDFLDRENYISSHDKSGDVIRARCRRPK